MKRISVTINDAMYDALLERAREEGESPDPTSGKYQKTLRHALRYYLTKHGSSAARIDVSDSEYENATMGPRSPSGGRIRR